MSKKKHKSLKDAREILEECHTLPTKKSIDNGKKLMKYFDEFDVDNNNGE